MKYRAEIDGLRALAVVPVILFHGGFELFSGGFVGVDVFFVISGYLITAILVDEIEKQRFSFAGFYERRARRILPALFFVMLVCIPFAWMWMMPSQMEDFSKSLIAVGFFASNFFFWKESDYFDVASEEKPLLHTWSLAVEEQYYVLFPIFLIFAWRYGKNRVFWIIAAMALFSLLLSEWGWRHKATANFYWPLTRAWELFAGSIAAFIVQKRGVRKSEVLSLLGLAAIVFSIFVYSESTPFPSLYALVPVLGVFLLLLFAGEKTLVAKLLSYKAFVGIGLISYSAYLWHQPLFAFARVRLFDEPSSVLMLALSIASLVLAFLSWKYVETPFRDKKIVSRKRLLNCAASVFAALMLVGFGGRLTDGFESRIPLSVKHLSAYNMGVFEENVKDCWQAIEDEPSVSSGCALGKEGVPPSFVLLGDSHAGALQSQLSNGALKKNLSGVGLSYRSCPPFSTAIDTLNDRVCSTLRGSIFSEDKLEALPENVIVFARWALLIERERYTNNHGYTEDGSGWIWEFESQERGSYRQNMQNEIVSSLNKIISSGHRLIIIYPAPEMGWSVPTYLGHHLMLRGGLDPLVGSVSYDSYKVRNDAAVSALDAVGNGENVVRVYPGNLLCERSDGYCPAHKNGEPLYYDDDHLSDVGAKIVVEEIIKSLRK